MNKIDTQIRKIKSSKSIGLMTHVVVGYPNLRANEQLIQALVLGGSDFVELQIPFSDPLADGPLIMQANEIALKQHVNVKDVFKLLNKCKKKYDIPFLLMGYFNSLYSYGVRRFCEEAKKNGASGLIIPDIPPEEEHQENFLYYCFKNDLYAIRVLSPASTSKRVKINLNYAKGFLYLVRGYGVTGSSIKMDKRLKTLASNLKKNSSLPLALGFGIAKSKDIDDVRDFADIVVVGSAIIDIIMNQGKRINFRFIEKYLRSLHL